MNILSKLILIVSLIFIFSNSSLAIEGENACSLCQYVAFKASTLQGTGTDQQIINKMVNFCKGEYGNDPMHPDYPIICSNIATQYGSRLIQEAKKGNGPDASCKNINICGKPF